MKTTNWKRFTWGAALLAVVASAGWAATDGGDSKEAKTLPPMTQVSPEVEQAIESANNLSTAFRTVANRLLPAVVSIENRPSMAWQDQSQVQPSQDGLPDNPFKGTPFEDMFRGRNFRALPPGSMSPRGPMRGQPAPGGIGSGVIIDASGIVLTNNHVVAGGGEVTVKTHDGREFTAVDVWTDPQTDVAVVKIDAPDLVAAPIGNSDNVEIGDWVVALGQPFGLESTVTAGIISAKNRAMGITDRENFLQTDAAINPGNSGGPLCNLRGEVIGINTAISSRSGGNEGIGFAIPSNLARWVSDQLVNTGSVRRAYLGVGIQPVTQALAKQLGVAPRSGAVVTDVYPATPAAKSGLQSGDVIVKFDGQAVSNPQQLQLAVERSEFGKQIKIDIVRDGKAKQLSYQPEEQPSDFGTRTPAKQERRPSQRLENFGLEVAPMDAEVSRQLGMDGATGVVITVVQDNSPAAEAGLEAGMVISQVNRQPVETLEEFAAAMEQSGDGSGTLLLVRTEHGSRFIVLN